MNTNIIVINEYKLESDDERKAAFILAFASYITLQEQMTVQSLNYLQ